MKKFLFKALSETSCNGALVADFIYYKGSKSVRISKAKTCNNRIEQVLTLIIFILFLMMGIGSSYSQSLNDLEKRYEKLNTQLEIENRLQDSLKNIYSYKTTLINIEKEKKEPDNEIIVGLMAGSVAMSNKIEEQSRKIKRTENEIEKVKEKLHYMYIAKIDSLESLKKNSKSDENKIDAEILMLTERNILVAPKIVSLSFNPEKILQIDLNKNNDAKEKILYKEYLDNALIEVNNLLETVNKQVKEVNQIIALQTKTKKFLEDAELENNMILQSQRNQADGVETITRLDESITTTTSSGFEANVKNYKFILRQLDIQQLSKTDLKLKLSFEETDRKLDIKEYQKLLKEVKVRLQEFKLVLANKIGSAK